MRVSLFSTIKLLTGLPRNSRGGYAASYNTWQSRQIKKAVLINRQFFEDVKMK